LCDSTFYTVHIYEHYHLGTKVAFIVINLRAQYYLTLNVKGYQSNVKRFGSYLKENTKWNHKFNSTSDAWARCSCLNVRTRWKQ